MNPKGPTLLNQRQWVGGRKKRRGNEEATRDEVKNSTKIERSCDMRQRTDICARSNASKRLYSIDSIINDLSTLFWYRLALLMCVPSGSPILLVWIWVRLGNPLSTVCQNFRKYLRLR